MTTFATGNPIGSKSPKDLYDNTENLDFLALGNEEFYPDRLGVLRYSWYGFEQEFFRFLVASGFEPNHLTYVEGTPLQVDRPTQLIDYLGSVYRVKMPATFPVMLSGDWGADEALLVDVGDMALRQALALASGSTLVGFSAEDSGQPVTNLSARGRRFIVTGDYASAAAAASAVALGRIYLDNRNSFNLTVGTGGQYATLNAAIAGACRMRPVQGQGLQQCTITLLSGFVLQEQLLVTDGSDLSWIKIVAEDSQVAIDPAFITVALSANDDSYPAFGAIWSSKLPMIGALFAYASNLTSRDGVAVMQNSEVLFAPGAGVIRARRGLLVFYGAHACCYPLGLTQGGDGTGAGLATGVDFSYARLRAFHAAYGARASLGRSMLHHCDGDFGAYVIWNSHVDLYQSNASYCVNGTAFHARDGATLNCREANGSHSKRAFHALHRGAINARSRLSGPTMIWIGEGAQFCTEYGVLASGNSDVEASELNAGNCTGSAGVSVSNTSRVSFIGGSAQNCTNRGAWAQSEGGIDATGANFSNSRVGMEASSGRISANAVTATGCSQFGALAYGTGSIEFDDGNLSGCGRGAEARGAGVLSGQNANLSGAGERGLSAIDGGTAHIQGANCSNAGSRGITARNGARVTAVGADCSNAGNWAAEVIYGSQITLNTGSITGAPLNVAPNTLTSDGIIYL